jgi:hypothetical protein
MRTSSTMTLYLRIQGTSERECAHLEAVVQGLCTELDACSRSLSAKERTEITRRLDRIGNPSKTRHLVLMFGASKLSMSYGILIPSPINFQDSISLNTASARDQDKAWEDKVFGIVWRGADSTNPHYQLFVSMMNATVVREAQMHPKTADQGLNSALSTYPKYINTSTEYMDLPIWPTLTTNVGFTSIDGSTTSTFKPVSSMNASTQHSPYKFLPSFSSTTSFLAHVHSTSVPLVCSLHTTRLSSRIVPWLHFVPIDTDLLAIWPILDYFVGNGKASRDDNREMASIGAHDGDARRIAMEGREWAERVVRGEDMSVYLGRVAIEWGRMYGRDVWEGWVSGMFGGE